MKQWYDSKPKGAKKFVIRKVNSTTDLGTCDAVYIAHAKHKDFETIKNSTSGKAVLTITDGLTEQGSCINFKEVNGKLKFELNQKVVSDSNLKVASQLASLAK